jgi:asparagine synthetase B (glutamine-hydrolysing)
MDPIVFASPTVFHKIKIDNYKDLQILHNIQHNLNRTHFLIDRSETVRLPFLTYVDKKYQFPINDIGQSSFLDVCLQSIENLKKENKTVYILWSGGIDSTMILVLFLMANYNKDQIVVVCNSDSISEYYWFWKNHIKDKFQLMATEKLMQFSRFNIVDGIIISGEPNDGFFGGFMANRLLDHFPPSFLHLHASRDNILKTTKILQLDHQSENCFYDLMMTTATNSPRKIETIFDFYWWHGYNFMWMHNIEKLKARMHPETDQRLFFADNLLQSWAIKNLEPLKYQHSYKKDYQTNIIYDYTKDRNYFDNKIKYESMTKNFQTYTAYIKTKDKKIIHKNANILEYYQSDNYISNWLLDNSN